VVDESLLLVGRRKAVRQFAYQLTLRPGAAVILWAVKRLTPSEKYTANKMADT